MQDIPHSTRSLASANQSPDMSYLIPPYLALYISGGHIGLPILVGTLLFSKRIRRPPAVTNMLITWILESISYCLVLYTGPTIRQHPPFTLCLLQAAFVHAAPPTQIITHSSDPLSQCSQWYFKSGVSSNHPGTRG
ncbi:hypothetical protein QCA50_002467 [Cerrena zonata]|uniref:Uncharacterized protein n=1 Tax=Cerrena zonata TaxID=2478898 RepID=A0AAW0GY15_9APHY